jgi:hypothetical protein
MKKASELFDGSNIELLPMTLPEAIKTLEKYNKWRLKAGQFGVEIDCPNPKEITEALEIAINLLKQLR